MSSILSVTNWTTMTQAINKVKSPNSFLTKLLYSNHQTLPTPEVLIDIITGGRIIAPFVRKNGEAIIVGGTGSQGLTVSTPNIRLKQPQSPSNALFARQPGTNAMVGIGDSVIPAIDQGIARDVQHMGDMVTNATEYLVAQSLQGTISYSVADGEVFTITIPRSAGNSIILTTFWDDADPTKPRVLATQRMVQQVMADGEGLAPTDAICGSEAAAQLLELAESGNLKWTNLDGKSVVAGTIDFAQNFTDDGVIYLGTIGTIRYWQYSRTATLNGVSTAMIRAKWIEYVSVSPSSERTLYFGSIEDMDALRGGQLQTERFAKQWTTPDPSVLWNLVHSKPLPWPRRPDATVSVKVISG